MDSKTEAGVLIIGAALCIFFARALLGRGSESKNKSQGQGKESNSKGSSLLLNTDKIEFALENGTHVVFSIA
ncbi:MAG: hypothetical protein IKO39_11520 [Treponema sp.]|nr:hypothetical protein [Treponema sp.]